MNSEWFTQSLRDQSERLRLADRLRLAVKVIPVVVRPVRRQPMTRSEPEGPPAQLEQRPVAPVRRRARHTSPTAAPGRSQEHRLDAIGVWSLARVALLFYVTVLVVIVVGIGVAWFLASQLGYISNVERFMQQLGFQDFKIFSGKVALGAAMVAAVLVTTWVVLTITAAALYNVVAVPWGGVRVKLTPLTDDAPLTISPNGNAQHGANGNGHENGNGNGNGNGRVHENGNGNGRVHEHGNGNGHANAPNTPRR